MLKSIGPTRPLLSLQMLPAKVAKPLPPAKKEIEVYRTRPASPDQEGARVDLHDDIPPELLAIPQMLLGSFAAVASYRSNQPKWAPPAKPADKREYPGIIALVNEKTPRRALIDRAGTQGVKPSEKGAVSRHHPSASPNNGAPPTRSNDDWPFLSLDDEEEAIETAAPEPTGAGTTQTSNKKSYFQGLLDAANDAYYDLLTCLPYTARIFMNMLA